MKSILTVCTANKTRSVMAMEIANYAAGKVGAPYLFKSAGLAPVGGEPDLNVGRVLGEIGIKTNHTPVYVKSIDITEFSAFHVMNQRQKITLASFFKHLGIDERITVLNIDDPFTKGIAAYRECREKLLGFYERFVSG